LPFIVELRKKKAVVISALGAPRYLRIFGLSFSGK
jgi:hypothetical protein